MDGVAPFSNPQLSNHCAKCTVMPAGADEYRTDHSLHRFTDAEVRKHMFIRRECVCSSKLQRIECGNKRYVQMLRKRIYSSQQAIRFHHFEQNTIQCEAVINFLLSRDAGSRHKIDFLRLFSSPRCQSTRAVSYHMTKRERCVGRPDRRLLDHFGETDKAVQYRAITVLFGGRGGAERPVAR
jgi:hypothetical protein